MPDFSRIINQAYMRILGRPADPGGLENYNRLLNAGMSESQMRESLIRSGEYATKNPETLLARAGAVSARKRSSSRKASKKKKSATRSSTAANRRKR